MKTYQHLNKEERKILALLLKRGDSLRSIARDLGRTHSSLSRELRRNLTQRYYHPLKAEFLSIYRHRECHSRPRLKSDSLRIEVEARLRQGWSPEIIAGRLKKEQNAPVISHEAIYQWVYDQCPDLIKCLPRHRFKRRPRHARKLKHMFPGRVSVQERSPLASSRQQPGHWEVDLVVGKGKAALKVAVERKTRFTCISKVPDKTADASFIALCRMFSPFPDLLLRSVTYDNGWENCLHAEINHRFGLLSFFCFPGHCWEKPTVENTNGLIRRFLPKRTNFDIISDEKILEIQNWLNSRPRKCLQFLTPAEALLQAIGALTG